MAFEDFIWQITRDLLTINDFQTLFLIIVAITITKPIEKLVHDTFHPLIDRVKSMLNLAPDEGPSVRTVATVLYLILATLAWMNLKISPSNISPLQELTAIFAFPVFAYVTVILITAAITYTLLFILDIFVFLSWISYRFHSRFLNNKKNDLSK